MKKIFCSLIGGGIFISAYFVACNRHSTEPRNAEDVVYVEVQGKITFADGTKFESYEKPETFIVPAKYVSTEIEKFDVLAKSDHSNALFCQDVPYEIYTHTLAEDVYVFNNTTVTFYKYNAYAPSSSGYNCRYQYNSLSFAVWQATTVKTTNYSEDSSNGQDYVYRSGGTQSTALQGDGYVWSEVAETECVYDDVSNDDDIDYLALSFFNQGDGNVTIVSARLKEAYSAYQGCE